MPNTTATRPAVSPGRARRGSQGLVYCGRVADTSWSSSTKAEPVILGNYLRQQFRDPVCQYLPADLIDAQVIEAFFAALSPVELDAYTEAMAARTRSQNALTQAQTQQLQRLRYQVALAERQFLQVDPDNRLVAVELERRWEEALRELNQAEARLAQAHQAPPATSDLAPQLRAAFTALGQRLPAIWHQGLLRREQQKALLRCLIDKVVVHRAAADRLHLRIVWKGEQVSTFDLPVPVGSLADYSQAEAMTARILALFAEGQTDADIASQLTAEGFRSPMRSCLLPSTVKTIRLRHGCMQLRRQSHPRRIPGCLTVPQLADALALSRHWLYDRIHNGAIRIRPDTTTGLYLFPDEPATLEQLRQLRDGILNTVRFS
jgi:hypothetical protein